MAHDVFVSYSTPDKLIGDAACAALEARGIRCWIAPRDIVPGRDWGEAIVDGINGARVMVLVFSRSANASQQVKREVERAVHRGLIIIPLRIEDVLPESSLEYFLGTPHWLDALTPPLEAHLHRLGDVVASFLSGEPPPPPPKEPVIARIRTRSTAAIAGAVAVMTIVVVVALLAGKSHGSGANRSQNHSSSTTGANAAALVGSWKLESGTTGMTKWDITFTRGGTYSEHIVFHDDGTTGPWGSGGGPGPSRDAPFASFGPSVGNEVTSSIGLSPAHDTQRSVFVYRAANSDVVTAGGLLPAGFFTFIGASDQTAQSLNGSLPGKLVSAHEWTATVPVDGMSWSVDLTARDGKYSFTAQYSAAGHYDIAAGGLETVSSTGFVRNGNYRIVAGPRLVVTSGTAFSVTWERS